METPEQAQLRQHLRELRTAAHGIGRDLRLEFSDIDTKITRLGKMTRREAKYALLDLEEDMSALGRSIDSDLRRLPGAVHTGVVTAGTAISSGVVGAASATRDALVDAGSATKEAGKNAFARLAGVNRKPMKEWKKR
jgi:hypothetical protein